MKKSSFLIIALALSGFLQAQIAFSKEQKNAQEAIIKMFEALSSRDSVMLKSYCTPDITLYEYGQVWNLDTLIRKAIVMNTSPDFKRTNSFEFINTELDKTKAWVTYRLNSVIYNNGKESTVQWLETVVLSKQNGQWKMKHLHSTLLKRT
ncbi:MAG: nuclear transport factor 2 family protein [Chitinophagaceae bacterium]|nr:nuclear transport factor 2 family protein [Chitinophagaceae bacterium]